MNEYQQDLSRIKTPNAQEQVALHARMRAGDQEARRILIESCLKFVYTRAASFARPGIDLDEIVGAVNLEVVSLIEKWEPEKGALTTWMAKCIGHFLSEWNRQQESVYLPISVRDLADQIEKDDGIEEIVEKFGVSKKRAQEVLSAKRVITTRVDAEGLVAHREDSIPRCIEECPHASYLFRLIKRLPKKQKISVRLYLGIGNRQKRVPPLSLRQIGEILGVSYTMIENYLRAAFETLKRRFKRKLSEDGLARFGTCRCCGKPLHAKTSRKAYCNDACKSTYLTQKWRFQEHREKIDGRTCKYCGKPLDTTRRLATLFCNENCKRSHRTEQQQKSRPVVVKTCKFCGKDITTTNKRKVFCNRACKNGSQREVRHAATGQDRTQELVNRPLDAG